MSCLDHKKGRGFGVVVTRLTPACGSRCLSLLSCPQLSPAKVLHTGRAGSAMESNVRWKGGSGEPPAKLNPQRNGKKKDMRVRTFTQPATTAWLTHSTTPQPHNDTARAYNLSVPAAGGGGTSVAKNKQTQRRRKFPAVQAQAWQASRTPPCPWSSRGPPSCTWTCRPCFPWPARAGRSCGFWMPRRGCGQVGRTDECFTLAPPTAAAATAALRSAFLLPPPPLSRRLEEAEQEGQVGLIRLRLSFLREGWTRSIL